MSVLDFLILALINVSHIKTRQVSPKVCQPAKITIDENSEITIKCPVNSLINIQSVVYGPNRIYLSKWYNCRFVNVTSIVGQLCNNKEKCKIQSNNNKFTDPCVGKFKYTVVNYSCYSEAVWSNWNNWASCNALYEVVNRTRKCNAIGSTWCCGKDSEVEKCLAAWTEWSIWSSCNLRNGYKNRTRYCNTSKNSTEWCCGSNNETNKCFADWSQWNPWSNCNFSSGFINRTRKCVTFHNSTVRCEGGNNETLKCYADWGEWSDWSICLRPVIGGIEFTNRTRECSASSIQQQCLGEKIETKNCSIFLTQWGNWSTCNVSDGIGLVNRTRQCYSSNMTMCSDKTYEVQQCYANWEQWGEWSFCNHSVYGFMSRSRICNASYTKELNMCYGDNYEFKTCYFFWTEWSNWTSCDDSTGLMSRTRQCNGSFPNFLCGGDEIDEEECFVDGMWGSWLDSRCEKQCGNEVRIINRSCDNPQPLFYGRNCVGISVYYESCEDNIVCPVNGQWLSWSSWSPCNKPCERGNTSRFRSCSNPKYGGLTCIGKNEEVDECNFKNCNSVNVSLAVNFLDVKNIRTNSDPSYYLRESLKAAVTSICILQLKL